MLLAPNLLEFCTQDIIRGALNCCLHLLIVKVRVYFRKAVVGWLPLSCCLLSLGYLPLQPLSTWQKVCFTLKGKEAIKP